MAFDYGSSTSYGSRTPYGSAGLRVRIAQAWMELPDPGGAPTAVRIARAYLLVASPSSAVQAARLWMEVPDVGRAVRIARAFLSVPSLAGGPGEGTGGPVPDDPGTPGGIDPGTGEEVVVTFERMLELVDCTAPRGPRGKQSWSHYGTGQFRPTVSAGIRWSETYVPVRFSDPRWWRFHAYLNELAQNERVFLIALPERVELGAVAGAPIVDGANQVGYQLQTSGWTGDMMLGDVVKIEGLEYVFTVMQDVSGPGVIHLNPAIREGGSPADGAAITYGGSVLVRAKIDEIEMPESGPGGIYAGLTISFREVP